MSTTSLAHQVVRAIYIGNCEARSHCASLPAGIRPRINRYGITAAKPAKGGMGVLKDIAAVNVKMWEERDQAVCSFTICTVTT
jgi:hypothetical protein